MLDSNSRLPCSRQVTQQSASLFTPSDTCTWKATVASASHKLSESGHCFSKGFIMSHFAFHVEISIAWYSLLVMPVSSRPLQQRSPLYLIWAWPLRNILKSLDVLIAYFAWQKNVVIIRCCSFLLNSKLLCIWKLGIYVVPLPDLTSCVLIYLYCIFYVLILTDFDTPCVCSTCFTRAK